MDIDEAFFHALLNEGDLQIPLDSGILPTDFEGEYQKVYDYILSFTNNPKNKGKIPSKSLIEHKFKFYRYRDTTDTVNSMCEELLNRHEQNTLLEVLSNVKRHFEQDSFDLEKARQAFLEGSLVIANRRGQQKYIDLNKNGEARIQEYEKRKNGIDVYGTPSGFSPLDELTLGFQPEDLIYLIGKSGSGKSWSLIKMAETANESSENHPVLILPLEMRSKVVMMRYDSIRHKLHYNLFKRGKLSQEQEDQFRQAIKTEEEKRKASFIVASDEMFEGGVITPLTLKAAVRNLKVKSVYIDGVYMMQSDNRGKKEWRGDADVGENIKRLCRSEGVYTVMTNQIKTDVTPEDATMESGAGHGWHRYCDVALKIYRGKDEVSANLMKMKILKVREEAVPEDPYLLDWSFAPTSLGNAISTFEMPEMSY